MVDDVATRHMKSILAALYLDALSQNDWDEYIQGCLLKLEMTFEDVESAAEYFQDKLEEEHVDLSDIETRDIVYGYLQRGGKDASRPSLVILTFSKKVTSRREWFEDLARAVASPMGVEVAANRADGCFGRTGHNGVALCGHNGVALSGVALEYTEKLSERHAHRTIGREARFQEKGGI